MSFEMFLQHCFNALTLGSLYALIAIGYYTMVSRHTAPHQLLHTATF